MKETAKLYYADGYVREFDACVVSCQPEGERYRVVLDRTAFFPKGAANTVMSGAWTECR